MGTSLTPLMQQYHSIKNKYPGYILFFRLGDFYEMFDNDAIIASKVLQITLTSRDKKKENAVPLCGVPYHSAESYINCLLKHNHKVAICEQTEDPKKAKGIVKREVVRLITPGTLISSDMLNEKENNYLASFSLSYKAFSLAFLELTTGEFIATEYQGNDYLDKLYGELAHKEAKEIIMAKSLKKEAIYSVLEQESFYITTVDESIFDHKEAQIKLKSFLNLHQLDGLGIDDESTIPRACAGIIDYIQQIEKKSFVHIETLKIYHLEDYMILDNHTRVNLELVNSLSFNSRQGSLLWVLDHTATAMGARRLKSWILHPLIDMNEINTRLESVEELITNQIARHHIADNLTKIFDLERIIGRISLGLASAQHVLTLKESIPYVHSIKKELRSLKSNMLNTLETQCHSLAEVYELIDKTLSDHPPSHLAYGGLIKRGVSEELDQLISMVRHSKDWLAKLEAQERKATGINSLKIGFNKVFGYYIEVTKSNLKLVPPEYIRKQTLASAERYITEELKQYEEKILGAEEKISALEKEIFDNLISDISSFGSRIRHTARAIAEIDCLYSLAETASLNRYSRPTIDTSLTIHIKEGRHPVLEKIFPDKPFIPNNTILDCDTHRLLILTGPNMAGKSTYMRQVALITLMAQIGSFVPATEAQIGIIDRLFTRIGAGDRLYRGQSTFMVEMLEIATILNNATQKSLIILDEIGRGTSTFDGISIAWAVAEFIHDTDHIGARTLLATHYHELTELASSLKGAKNYNIGVCEEDGRLIFLYQILPGSADKSYGIHVAKLAGLPAEVIERAYEILQRIEQREEKALAPIQLCLFTNPKEAVLKDLRSLDISKISPLKARKKINEWKKCLS
ncbi:MAG: DNA mismatch repair protein MutS [bacterium]